jgi:acetyl-CoA decarbonylase/synthase, CODH/ACS complex subunit gamma
MALTGMHIYKYLPKTNCKDCGIPTCMAFAMQVAAKKRAITDCPHISEHSKAELAEAASPPMKLVTIGTGAKAFVMGQETVLFRHDEKFHRKTGIAVRIAANLSDDEAGAVAEKIGKSEFIRVGEELRTSLVLVELDGCAEPGARSRLVSERSGLPVILAGSSTDAISQAAIALSSAKPLIWKATKENAEAFAAIALKTGASLAVSAGTLEELSDLVRFVKDKGAENIVLAFDAASGAETLRNLTIARRASLKKLFRELGYPTIVDCACEKAELETAVASGFAAKYSGIVIVDHFEPWELLPLMTIIQDVYRDPQVPNAVEAKLYEIGNPDENSPVLFTTNFSLTYFSVASEVERSKIPTFIAVVETEGLGVLNAYAGDKISVEKIVKTISSQKVSEKVKHRKLIIPGLLPMYRAEIEDTSEWKEVIIGPETAREIPAFLNKIWK